jgi:hypothetical protein
LIAQLLAGYPDIEQTSFDDLLMYPVLEREIESENLQALHVMLQYTTLLNKYNIMQKQMYELVIGNQTKERERRSPNGW